MPIKIPHMLSISETAKEFGLAQHYIRQLCLSGQITTVRAGKKWLINCDRLIDFLNDPKAEKTTGIRQISER